MNKYEAMAREYCVRAQRNPEELVPDPGNTSMAFVQVPFWRVVAKGFEDLELREQIIRMHNRLDTPCKPSLKTLEPTKTQLHSACLSYRHDYGIIDEQARESLRLTALEWLRVWQKECE